VTDDQQDTVSIKQSTDNYFTDRIMAYMHAYNVLRKSRSQKTQENLFCLPQTSLVWLHNWSCFQQLTTTG